MGALFGTSATNEARSADNLFNATNVTVGFRFLVPAWSTLAGFWAVFNLGSTFASEGGWVLAQTSTANNLYSATVSAGTEGFIENLAFTDAVWHSLVIKLVGTGAGSYNRWLFNHATGTLTTNLAATSTRSFEAGFLTLANRHDQVGGGSAQDIAFEDVWISHTAVPNALCEMYARGADGRFLLPHLLSYWQIPEGVSGTIPDLVGAAPLTVGGTAVSQPSGMIYRPMQLQAFNVAAVAAPFYTQTKFQIFNDDGSGLGPPP